MTDLDLDAIEDSLPAHYFDCDRLRTYDHGLRQGACDCMANTDVPALVAEVLRLREADEAHAVTVQQAVAVERQRDEARAEVERLQALVNAKQSWIDGAKVDCDGYDDARAAIAAVRALCANAEADPFRGVAFGGEPFPARLRVEDVRRALDVRHDRAATTDGGEATEALLGIVLAVAFVVLLLWRLTS